MLPIAEVLDHEGQPRFKPGDEIDVMREKGETEDGYPKLSHQKAQRLRAWDDIERAHNEKKPIKGVVVERIKGGLTVDINGARAFLPGSQVDLRPIRNLDGMKGQTIEVAVIKLNKKRGLPRNPKPIPRSPIPCPSAVPRFCGFQKETNGRRLQPQSTREE